MLRKIMILLAVVSFITAPAMAQGNGYGRRAGKGSRNHLRAFTSQLNSYGLSYMAQYLTQEEVDAIVYTPMERGILSENGDFYQGNKRW